VFGAGADFFGHIFDILVDRQCKEICRPISSSEAEIDGSGNGWKWI